MGAFPGAVQAPVHRGAMIVERGAATATVERGAATATVERGAATATIERHAAVATIERGAATANVMLQSEGFLVTIVCLAALASFVLRDVLVAPHAPSWLAYFPSISSYLPLLATAAFHRRQQITNGEMGRRMNQLQLANRDFQETTACTASIPQGTIFAWYPSKLEYDGGKLEAPVGYAVCDGQHGTPNLVGRFILGGDPALNPKKFKLLETGGSEEHKHAVTTTVRLRDPWVSGWDCQRHAHQNILEDALQLQTIQNKKFDGECGIVEHMPPFFTLVYIMKM
mmetsp:Transcript_83004/g.230544  ORF Transcript_83004/g.230544 Transcript_83004/m.230544 type:complete len:284 (+) Transcript_83004:51-902(+)|eukprot:CAMPEP_0179048208 /NCGR_PEP_ID=MMETSP0796-20121207/19593_1 /TAXON_ID=73915 /ORGANISM="Pyrodinium bahamense, Strain pbaha01" /LENGTH=283 /DNA_ID=CAMNT_0020744675 /DNA_START=51 /DNA_END=902 /DNA_ORIENTATION=+